MPPERVPAALACCGLLSALLIAASPPAAAEREIAVVTESSVAPYRAVLEEFRRACACRIREFSPEEARAEGFERRLHEAGTAAIFAIGLPARDAVESLREMPLLAAMAPRTREWTDAAGNRLGVSMAPSARGHLEAIREVYPRARRVAVLADPAWNGSYLADAGSAAAELGLRLLVREVGRPGEVPRTAAPLLREADVFWLLPDPTVLGAENLDFLLLESFKGRTPIHAFARKYVELGAVSALHPDLVRIGRQAGELLLRRLAGGTSAGPRFEEASHGSLVLNQKVARKMGIALPAQRLEDAADVVH